VLARNSSSGAPYYTKPGRPHRGAGHGRQRQRL